MQDWLQNLDFNMSNKKNTWKIIGISVFVFLAVYFVISIRGNINTYKHEIKSLQTARDSLVRVIDKRVSQDSVRDLLTTQERLNRQIESLENTIDSLKKKYDEKNWTDVYSLSTDSNIVILSKFLSEENLDK